MEKIKSIHGNLTFLFAILANLVVQFAAAFVITVGSFLGSDIGSSAVFNLLMMLCIQISFFFVFYLTVLRPKRELTLSVKNKIRYESLCFAPLIAALTICAFYLPTMWFMLALTKAGYTPSAGVEMNTPLEFVLGSFVLCVAAPVGEELIFRGALLSGLREKYGISTSVVLSGLAFMAMHMNPSQTVYQFFLGCTCALTAIAAGSILPSIIVHAFSNMFAILIDYTAIGTAVMRIEKFLTAHAVAGVFITLACVAVFTFAILVCVNFINKLNKKDPAVEGKITLEKQPLASKPIYDAEGAITIEKHEQSVKVLENKDKMVYIVACGVCALMWVIALVSGFLS